MNNPDLQAGRKLESGHPVGYFLFIFYSFALPLGPKDIHKLSECVYIIFQCILLYKNWEISQNSGNLFANKKSHLILVWVDCFCSGKFDRIKIFFIEKKKLGENICLGSCRIDWDSQSLYTAAILENSGPNRGPESKTCNKSERLFMEFHKYCSYALVSHLPNYDSDWPVSKYSMKHGRHAAPCIAPGAVPRCVNLRRTEA